MKLKILLYCNIIKITNLCGIKPSQIVSCTISVTRCNLILFNFHLLFWSAPCVVQLNEGTVFATA